MYVPPAFREDRMEALHAVIRTARLATLVTLGDDGLVASHLPMLLDPAAGPHGTLYGHLARANPQAREAEGGAAVPALAIFHGPDAYVSPGWYPSKAVTGRVVPTWNYVAVHCTGRLERFDDSARLRPLLARLTERHEAGRADPWSIDDAPDPFIAANLRSIVGVALPIERIEGKFKLSQNRDPADREGARQGLAASPDPVDRAVAALMNAPEAAR